MQWMDAVFCQVVAKEVCVLRVLCMCVEMDALSSQTKKMRRSLEGGSTNFGCSCQLPFRGFVDPSLHPSCYFGARRTAEREEGA